jgi:hypothetical protein
MFDPVYQKDIFIGTRYRTFIKLCGRARKPLDWIDVEPQARGQAY